MMLLISSIAVILPSLILYRLLRWRANVLPLPPGPPGLPVIGNFRDVATPGKDVSWVKFWKWSKIYGDIFHFQVFGHHTIVLSSPDTMNALLEKRSWNYSDRPGELINWKRLIMIGLDIHSILIGRLANVHGSYPPRVVPEYYDIQRNAVTELGQKLISNPEDFFDHVTHHSGSIILKITYGYALKAKDDPYLDLALSSLEGIIASGNHGSFWVDYLPVVKHVPAWFPGASFQRKAKVWRQSNKELKDRPWGWIKDAIVRVDVLT
ncbi:hypothetical protein PM082_022646 [Marasmius tenuissimus]|nr:hypothetical protein PM082_022646 [Marasmius tenuissimus]